MKPIIIIAGLAGLACGVVARKSQAPPPAPDDDPPLVEVSRSRRPSTGGNSDALISLSWELRGNLTGEELLALPHGGRLLAEMNFWSFKATPAELSAHWDKVIASGEDDLNTLDQLMTLWVRRDPQGALPLSRGRSGIPVLVGSRPGRSPNGSRFGGPEKLPPPLIGLAGHRPK